MKNLITTLIAVVALAVSATAFSQTTTTTTTKQVVVSTQQTKKPIVAKSYSYSVTTTSVSLLYLRDGYQNYTALSVPLYTLTPRLTANAIGSLDMNNLNKQVYAGTGLDWKVPCPGGFSFDVEGGLKGFNLASLNGTGQVAGLATGKGAFVFGIGFTFPLH